MARGWNLGVKVAFGIKDPHLSQLGADDLDPLLHDLPGVGGETDGHRLKVDHKGPFVVGRDEAGGPQVWLLTQSYPDVGFYN